MFADVRPTARLPEAALIPQSRLMALAVPAIVLLSLEGSSPGKPSCIDDAILGLFEGDSMEQDQYGLEYFKGRSDSPYRGMQPPQPKDVNT